MGSSKVRAANETIGQHITRLTQSAIKRWQNTLAASEDPISQAAGLALQNAHPDSPEDGPKDTPANNSLVLLAIETNKPAIYALALRKCGDGAYGMIAGPCQALSWEHWANIDPDNAAPWIGIAARAVNSGDQQGADEAMAKASMASRVDGYGGTLIVTALSALPQDITPLEKAVAGVDVITTVGMGTQAFDIANTLCSDEAIQQQARMQQCTSLTNDLADRGTTYIELAVVLSLAKRLGFSQDRLDELQLELQNDRKALRGHNPWNYTNEETGFKLRSDFDCDKVLGYDAYIDALLTAGGNERAALATLSGTAKAAK